MGDSYIQLPADSSGKKLATRQRTVGANTVEEQYVISRSVRVNTGVYLSATGVHTIVIAASSPQNGTSTGFWWLYNPGTSGTIVALRRIRFMSQMAAATVAATSPRIMLQAFTYTGSPSGTVITPRKTDTTMAAAVATLRSTQATSAVTLTQQFHAFLPYATQLSSSGGPAAAADSTYAPDEDEQIVLAANEGVVCYQADAGTATTDGRRFVTNITWSEYTVP